MDGETVTSLLTVIQDAVSKPPSTDDDIAQPVFDPDKNDCGAESWCDSVEGLAEGLKWSSIRTAARADQNQAHPQHVGGYPQQVGGYPQQGGGYPQQGGGYPQQVGGYPPQSVGYPQEGGGYPQQGGGYPQSGSPQGGHPQGGYPKGYPVEPPQPGFQPAAYGGGEFNVPSEYAGPGVSIVEDGEVKGFDFTEQSIRRAFIRKVYAILMCQLLVTMGFICLFLFHQPTRLWVHHHRRLSMVAFGVVFLLLLMMACFGEMRRKAPMNFIFLGIITVGQSFILGVVSSMYNVDTVLIAVGITAALCLALTLFAFQTKWDFTVMGGMLFCFLVILILFGLIAIFLPANRIVTLVYASMGALLFSFYLVYDTQLMMGGKHKYTVSPEEYIFAALNLYLDIINLFMYILLLMGRK